MVLREPLHQTTVDRGIGGFEVHPSVGDHPGLGIDVELQPFSAMSAFGIGQSDVPGGNQDTWQSLDGHVIGGQTQRALVDHHGAIGFVDFLFLKIVDAFCFDIERKRTGG